MKHQMGGSSKRPIQQKTKETKSTKVELTAEDHVLFYSCISEESRSVTLTSQQQERIVQLYETLFPKLKHERAKLKPPEEMRYHKKPNGPKTPFLLKAVIVILVIFAVLSLLTVMRLYG